MVSILLLLSAALDSPVMIAAHRETDEKVFSRTLEEFWVFLEEEEGSKTLKRISNKSFTPYDFSRILADVTGKKFGVYYSDFYDWLEAKSPAGAGWIEVRSEHFTYLYQPRTAAEHDMALIQAVFEDTYRDVVSILEPDSAQLARADRLIGDNRGKRKWTHGRITVRLHPHRTGINNPEATSRGRTSFLPQWFEDTVGYYLSIDLTYPGPAGLFGVPHEVAHALEVLLLSDEQPLANMLRGGKYVHSGELSKALPAQDVLRSEGWAYMVQYNFSAYTRLDMMNSSGEVMERMDAHYGFPDVEELYAGKAPMSFGERALVTLGIAKPADSRTARYMFCAGDLMRFLYEEYGAEKLRLFLTNHHPVDQAVEDIYGLSASELEDAWRADVLGGE